MKNSCWYEEWFDSPYYHLLYNKRDVNEANFFIDNLCRYLNLPEEARIWDIACGKGRHALAFAKKGYNVIGTDLSESSIHEALENKSCHLDFFVHDMRKIFRTNYFDCALNLFTSFGYFEKQNDNYKVFKNIYSSLKPGGIFVVDFFNAEKVKLGDLCEYDEKRGDLTFHISKKIENNTIRKKINFEDRQQSFCFEEAVSLLQKENFEDFASTAGFKLVDTFGNYALEGFNKKNSDRLILIFKK